MYQHLTKLILVGVVAALCAVIGTPAAFAQTQIYSELFGPGQPYKPGSSQWDNWITFRASLPTSDVKFITLSGSRRPVGRTCSDPVKAQDIADAMLAGAAGLSNGTATLSVFCDGFFWSTGSCSGDINDSNNLQLGVGTSANPSCNCSGSGNNDILRPAITGNVNNTRNWGGIDGLICNAPTQTMTVTVSLDSFVTIDIKFCSNPNGFNSRRTKGVVPVTIFGNLGLDVTDIDISTVMLCEAGNLANCAGPPVDASIDDRGDPVTDIGASQCAIIESVEQDFLNPDGIDDLDVAFDAAEVCNVIDCDSLGKGDTSIDLVVTGEIDSTVFLSTNSDVLDIKR